MEHISSILYTKSPGVRVIEVRSDGGIPASQTEQQLNENNSKLNEREFKIFSEQNFFDITYKISM